MPDQGAPIGLSAPADVYPRYGPDNATSVELDLLQLSASTLAQAHSDVQRPQHIRAQPLLVRRLETQLNQLRQAHDYFRSVPADQIVYPYAGEWLLDNFYVIEETVRQIREDLPPGYYRQLPELTGTSFAGYPRIYAVADQIVSHTLSAIISDDILRFLNTYQEIQPLTIGELWALPIMLRLAVVQSLTTVLTQLARLDADLVDAQPRSSEADRADENLVAHGIQSLRILSTQDWKMIFESTSRVERVLRGDPDNHYEHMDFATRDHYRAVIEKMARSANLDEATVAQSAITLARTAVENSSAARLTHVGYYLIDAGQTQLEAALKFRPNRVTRAQRWLKGHPTLIYLGGIVVLTAVCIIVMIAYAISNNANIFQWIAVIGLGLIPASTVAVGLVNWLVSLFVKPRALPRMDFDEGVPGECRTMIVIPALLAPNDRFQNLVQQLELHYLRNSDPYLGFALLTDFADADEQHRPEDSTLIEQISQAVEALNAKHNCHAFYIFHRERLWNASEECWMAWERKRGKLAEFNRLLRGAQDTSFVTQIGNLDVLSSIRYVITLDADTVLPSGSARVLIATLAHPLNRAVFAPNRFGSESVVAGYTLLQPRTEVQPTSVNRSRFTQVYAGDTGLDLYTRAVSDVYQDLFGEGTYVGKGIYDVDAFERSVHGRIPENSLLSHDLFEGIQGRAALITDVVLLEDYPPNYLTWIHRQHRWMRGDWQLLPWLGRNVPNASGRIRNPLPFINRWKIADNLRRSLLAPGLMIFLLLGWLWLPGSPLVWSLTALFTLCLPAIISIINAVIAFVTNAINARQKHTEIMTRADIVRPVWMNAARCLLALVFLPYEAAQAVDAIGTTLVRVFITHQHLLRWVSAAHTLHLVGRKVSLGVTLWKMKPALVAVLTSAILIGLLLVIVDPVQLIDASVVLLAWLASPVVAYWLSHPLPKKTIVLTGDQRQHLRTLARRTWLFFEQFVGPDDHWLPPDHFQEQPVGIIAHQTSPTNIGLYLLSALAAYDLGYIRRLDLVTRLRETLTSMSTLQRHRGHLLNWYDTRTLAPLLPAYVSTVDSGNLAACLLALQQGCEATSREPGLRWERWEGLLDIFAILDEIVAALIRGTNESSFTPLKTFLANMQQVILSARADETLWMPLIDRLYNEGSTRLNDLLLKLVQSNEGLLDMSMLGELRVWIDRARFHLASLHDEWHTLAPWLSAIARAPDDIRQACSASPAINQAWQMLNDAAPTSVNINQLPDVCDGVRACLVQLIALLADSTLPVAQSLTVPAWCAQLDEDLKLARATAITLLEGARAINEIAETFFRDMDFRFLFNSQRQIFHIGYNLASATLDNNYYDLLASESRITSLIAIAKGDAPASHWMHLARPLTVQDGLSVMLSWSGTMFEYLMPQLLVRDYDGMFLAQSCRAAVEVQMAYGKQRRVPWGISESGYYAFDANKNHQYRAFGVPGLGFKRGLSDDLVVTPYASLLALPYFPEAVLSNLRALSALGASGRYGLYEAIDFTPERLPPGQTQAVVQSYMAHHQAMNLLSLTNVLREQIMIRRFHADARIRSVDLLLQEKNPLQAPVEYPHAGEADAARVVSSPVSISPWPVPPDTPLPQAHLLSNGDFTTVITNAGTGYCQWRDIALTRWSADPTLDDSGMFVYVQDLVHDRIWSATRQPIAAQAAQTIHFHAHMAEFQRTDYGITLRMEVTVASDHAAEVRRITLINTTDQLRTLRVTSYGEVVLASRTADQRHSAFNKLFIESEFVRELNAQIFRRRPRSTTEVPIYLAHVLTAEPGQDRTGANESDRARFLGRGNTLREPATLCADGIWLTGTTGATLDPILSLGQDVELAPHSHVQIALITVVAASRDECLALVQRYQAWSVVAQTFDQARRHSEANLRQIRLPMSDLEHFEQLLSLLLYPHNALRAAPEILAANSKGQAGLYAYGVSGDYPIVLVRINEQHAPIIRELLRAHTYWRNRGIKTNIVFLNEHDTGYEQSLDAYLHRLLIRSGNADWLNRRDGLFVIRGDQLSLADRTLLETCAQAIFESGRGRLADQLVAIHHQPTHLPMFMPTRAITHDEATLPPTGIEQRPANLRFDNGLGGFSADGREYVIYLAAQQRTPAPWVNVIANSQFGCLTSESGLGCTWAQNSGENRLTPWRNDPVTDAPSEAIYLRDEETAEVWSPTPQPCGALAPYLIRHGAGYSIYEHHSHGLKQQLRVFVVNDAPVKVLRLRLENRLDRPRRITATYYAEWVLGTTAEAMRPFIVPEFDAERHTLLARNAYSAEFGQCVAFVTTNKPFHGVTTDRNEFLGRMGSLKLPEVLQRIGLASTVKAGLDSCAAMQVHVDLAPGASEDVYFLMGEGSDKHDALALAQGYKDPAHIEQAWNTVNTFWDDLLGTLTVETPDPAMNLMLNRWLLYQTLSCRLWGRTALYQSSGAFGFRDQLQDAMALLAIAPALVREYILNAARHQFEAGDVLHWWHPPTGRGVRTHCSDDLLWLPYVTAQYLASTQDFAILTEPIPFLKGAPLQPEEDDRYGYYEPTDLGYPLYEHCLRALEKGFTVGVHGLPLMGSGDWNDGMNRVGVEGRGESVWLGWFLHTTLTQFAPVCQHMQDPQQATCFVEQAEKLRQALEKEGWDGAWYRRAYYDDGATLGSAQDSECQIDAIAQSWAVLSGAGQRDRAIQAMQSVWDRLVSRQDQLVRLFTPPFDQSSRDPGYIKGYAPGIRENGGQYTHAAIWTAWAFAALGQADRAAELFQLLNPIHHADTPEKAQHYRAEPYVMAADVYGAPPHTGRGGWTWYTGSAGWMYRLGIEAILGFRKVGDHLRMQPCLPAHWPGFELTYTVGRGIGRTCYHIRVIRTSNLAAGESRVQLDGSVVIDGRIPLLSDGQRHEVLVETHN